MDKETEEIFEFANEMSTYFDECDKLNGQNYSEWKSMIKEVLVDFNFWDIVIGKECRPIDEDRQREYDRRERIARATILMSVTY